jgi:hypothetical protein
MSGQNEQPSKGSLCSRVSQGRAEYVTLFLRELETKENFHSQQGYLAHISWDEIRSPVKNRKD